MRYLVAGSTGLVGSQLVNLLRQRIETEEVREIRRKDYEHLSKEALQLEGKFDAAFCCLGTTIAKAQSQENFYKVDHDYVVSFFKLAKSLNIRKWVVVSSIGADSRSKVFYSRTKGQMEESLRALQPESLVILRPSLLLGERSEARPGEKFFILTAPLYAWMLCGPLEKYRPVSSLQVAEKMIERGLAATTGVEIIESIEAAQFIRD